MSNKQSPCQFIICCEHYGEPPISHPYAENQIGNIIASNHLGDKNNLNGNSDLTEMTELVKA